MVMILQRPRPDVIMLAHTLLDLVRRAHAETQELGYTALQAGLEEDMQARVGEMTARNLNATVVSLEHELALGLELLQDTQAQTTAARKEAGKERTRADCLASTAGVYREREEEHCERYRQHEEACARHAQDMQAREAESERRLLAAEHLFEYCREYGHSTEHHNACDGFVSTASPPPNHCSVQLAPDEKELGDVSNEPSQNAHESTWSSCRDTACGQKRRSVGGRRDLATVSLAVTPHVSRSF